MSRSVRLETRSRARDELRRAMKAIDKVKKWWADIFRINFFKLVSSFTTSSDQTDFLVYLLNNITHHPREKKWVPAGGGTSSTCKLKVYKWVPKETQEENVEDGQDAKIGEANETEGKVTTDQNTGEVKTGEKPESKENFPASQFLQTDQVILHNFQSFIFEV